MRGCATRRTTARRRRALRLRRSLRSESGFGLIEMLVATTIGSIGLLAVAGLQLATATQARIADWRTDQALAAQQVFEEVLRQGYAAAASGSYDAPVDGYSHRVTLTVNSPALRVKQLTAVVAPIGAISAQTFVTRIYDRRPVPAGP